MIFPGAKFSVYAWHEDERSHLSSTAPDRESLSVFHKLDSFSYRLFLGQSKSIVLSPSNRFRNGKKKKLFVSLAPSSSFKYHMRKDILHLPVPFNFAFFCYV